MAPNANYIATGQLYLEDADVADQGHRHHIDYDKNFKFKTIWHLVFFFSYVHLSAIYGVYLAFTSAKLQTLILGYALYVIGGLGITAGAHRLWSHKAYKANLPLRILLVLFNCVSFQHDAIEWARDHRVHHKYSETDADPQNRSRGFFFAHMGWLLVRKHTDCKTKGLAIDVSDLLSDPVLRFQRQYYHRLVFLISIVLPTLAAMHFWNESFSNAFHVAVVLRYVVTLNGAFLISSVGHTFGNRAYDKTIAPSNNVLVNMLVLGDGWHNFHHVFPWDYKSAELGGYHLNLTTAFIDFFARIGWATDLKTVSPAMIRARAKRTGDGSRGVGGVWGWGDKDMPKEDKEVAVVTFSSSNNHAPSRGR